MAGDGERGRARALRRLRALALVAVAAGCGSTAQDVKLMPGPPECTLWIFFRNEVSRAQIDRLIARLDVRGDVYSVKLLSKNGVNSLRVRPVKGVLPGHIAAATPRNPFGILYVRRSDLPRCAR